MLLYIGSYVNSNVIQQANNGTLECTWNEEKLTFYVVTDDVGSDSSFNSFKMAIYIYSILNCTLSSYIQNKLSTQSKEKTNEN